MAAEKEDGGRRTKCKKNTAAASRYGLFGGGGRMEHRKLTAGANNAATAPPMAPKGSKGAASIMTVSAGLG